MVDTVPADASPEKRLFVYLITRDISLADALLDLIDNSINAALQPLAAHLNTADDYQQFLAGTDLKPQIRIDLTVGSARILVRDTAPGISLAAAQNDVFRFGRAATGGHASDRLSVYGIGLKRAMFKCGNKINMVSEHREGGFELKLNARAWERLAQNQWKFDITPRRPATKGFGTQILITELHDDVVRRVEDGLFVGQLRDRITRTYSFFIGRVVTIFLNDQEVERESFEIGDNYASEKFTRENVSCNITAGMSSARGEVFRDKNSGWFVFCNGRAVLFADKSPITGWGGSGLPIFQPKHRPFLGTVFFVSPNPEALPWTTTKGSINEENAIWQEAKRHMVTVGRAIVSFLDRRYTEDDARITPNDLQDVSGPGISVFTAAVSNERKFQPPKTIRPKTLKIQYDAKVDDVRRIEKYLRRPSMGGSEVGRYTFRHFLKNEVGEG
jgi:hypothetical protein